jgi:hypothetical protein
MSGLEIRTSFMPLQWLLYFFAPKVAVNGVEYPLAWGTRLAPFPPGHYHVRVWVPYMFGPFGTAEAQVPIYEGQATTISYTAPMFMFSGGTLTVLGSRPYG